MHEGKIGSRRWHEDIQKDLIDQIERMRPIYQNIDTLFESWELRIVTALMANKGTSSERAIDPGTLPKRYERNIHLPIQKDLARVVNGKVYLTVRGKLVASEGMRRLVDNDMWPPNHKEVI